MERRIQKLSTSVVAILVCISTASSQFRVYSEAERGDWFTDVGGAVNVTTIGFAEFSNNTTLTDQYRNLGIVFEGLNFVSGPVPANYDDSWGLRIFNGNDLYFDEAINWFAADYLGSLRVELYSGEALLFEYQRPLPEQFSGVISDVPFDRIRVFDPTDPLTVIDDLHFGPPINVPAPGALAPFALLLIARRRRRLRS